MESLLCVYTTLSTNSSMSEIPVLADDIGRSCIPLLGQGMICDLTESFENARIIALHGYLGCHTFASPPASNESSFVPSRHHGFSADIGSWLRVCVSSSTRVDLVAFVEKCVESRQATFELPYW